MSLTRFRCANSLRPRGTRTTEMQNFLENKNKILMIGVGFEPTPPKRLVPKTSALDRSAIQPKVPAQRGWYTEAKNVVTTKRNVRPSGLEPESYPWKG